MSAPMETLAFLGATGGCAATVLSLSLKANYTCTALARTPSKLRNLLESQHGVPAATIDKYLTITQGNVTDEATVKAALTTNGRLPDKIVFGIGAAPKFQMSLIHPVTMDQPTICADGMSTLTSALRSLDASKTPIAASGQKPLVVCISTTGISDTRDVPLVLGPLYHVMLATPHKDKRNMEKLLIDATHEQDSSLSGFTVIRPTLLTDGKTKGGDAVKAGWVWPDGKNGSEIAPGPHMGYTISRGDVGTWIFKHVVQRDEQQWTNKCVSLAY